MLLRDMGAAVGDILEAEDTGYHWKVIGLAPLMGELIKPTPRSAGMSEGCVVQLNHTYTGWNFADDFTEWVMQVRKEAGVE